MDIYVEIYPVVIPGLSDKESIQDKRELAIQCINRMQSVIDGTQTKTLCFENHETIEDTLVKLKSYIQSS